MLAAKRFGNWMGSKEYPAFIVSIPGNHDCQPDWSGMVRATLIKFRSTAGSRSLMSTNPQQLGSPTTGAGRTQMDLPYVYWTFTTPLATIIGLFSNVGETEGEIHRDQIAWFVGELQAADPNLALIVAVHHPPYSGDIEHSGSSQVETVLFESFQTANRYPHLILSGHVHNYQRFTIVVQHANNNTLQIPCVVAGAGGYTKLGTLKNIPRCRPNGATTGCT